MSRRYQYRAKDLLGKKWTGTIQADTKAEVAALIREKGWFITQIKEVADQHWLQNFWDSLCHINTRDKALFCRQFATMMDAGMSMLPCLHILIDQTDNRKLKATLTEMYVKVQEGKSLSSAMKDYPYIFPSVMISMIEAGEIGGMLPTALQRLAIHFEKEHRLRQKIKSVMTYPAIVFSIAMLVVIFILTFVLPTFTKMFIDLHMELPLFTRILLTVSSFVKNNGLLLLFFVLLSGLASKLLCRNPKVKAWLDHWIMILPVFGILWRKIIISRFARTLGTLLRSGVPLILAMEVVKKTAENVSMVEALAKAQKYVKQGQGLAVSLSASRIFTPMVVQMVAIGEETGEMDTMLEKIADFYENDANDMVESLSSLLEPFLIGFLGILVGMIVIAVVVPMFDVVTQVGK